MSEFAVVIVGAGPTGLMLGAELRLAGVDAVVVERRDTQDLDGSRAGGLLTRTLEELDQRGVVDRFVAAGQTYPAHGFGRVQLDLSDQPSRHNYVLGLWQRDVERVLAGWVEEIGVRILRGREVTGVDVRPDGVDVTVADGGSMRAAYVVGCDGGRSLVRKAAGIDFIGEDATTTWLIAEVEMAGEPELGFRHDSTGTHAIGRRLPTEPIRLVLTEPTVEHTGPPDLAYLREMLVGIYGTDFGLRGAAWISRFTDATRQAVSYRSGRVLVAGDAAHVHPPQGGQGLNIGVQDSTNLGWKLAQVVEGVSPEPLLDSYHDERHPVGAQVLRTTLAQVALGSPGARHEALRDTLGELLAMDEPRRRMAARMCGLDIRYAMPGGDGDSHPLVGRRMPDLDLMTDDGSTRVYALLHEARHVLLDLGGSGVGAAVVDAARPRVVRATYDGVLELPVVGEVEVPQVVLVRPDGYVAWAGARGDDGLDRAVAHWCGR